MKKKDKKFRLIASENYKNSVLSFCITDDNRLATSFYDKIIRIFSLENYQCELKLEGHERCVRYVSKTSNGNLISSSDDNTIMVWEVGIKSFQCIGILRGHVKTIWKVTEISENRFLSCSSDFTLKIWSKEEPYQCIKTLVRHKNQVFNFIELQNQEYFLSCSWDSSIIIWNSRNYEFEKEIKVECGRNTTNYSLLEVDDDKVLFGSYEKIIIIDTLSFEIYRIMELEETGDIISLLRLPNGKILCGGNSVILQIDLLQDIIDIRDNTLHKDFVFCLLSLGDNKVISGGRDKMINIWEIE